MDGGVSGRFVIRLPPRERFADFPREPAAVRSGDPTLDVLLNAQHRLRPSRRLHQHEPCAAQVSESEAFAGAEQLALRCGHGGMGKDESVHVSQGERAAERIQAVCHEYRSFSSRQKRQARWKREQNCIMVRQI